MTRTILAIGAVGVAASLILAPNLVPVLIGFSAIGPVAGEFPQVT
jgi:hypothetical protein